jgi:hypothetical protein
MRDSLLFRSTCALVIAMYGRTGSAESTAPDEAPASANATAGSATSAGSPAIPKSTLPAVSAASLEAVEISLVTDDRRVALYAKETRKVTVHDEVADSWEFVCKAPCNTRVDSHRIYRVMGDGIVPSDDFNLAAGSGKVTLRVSPASHGTRVAGAAVASIGSVLLLSSGVLFLFDVTASSAATALGATSEGASAQSQLQSTANVYEIMGFSFLATGLVACVTALLLTLTSHTGLEPVGPSQHARLASPSGPRLIPGGLTF